MARRAAQGAAGRLLEPGRTCWRIERAGRAAVLVDGTAYFAAARAAMKQARHSVTLLGWNFAEDACFAPGETDPHWPGEMGPFLQALVKRREDLRVNLLLWDKVPALALGRRRLPGAQIRRLRSERLRIVLDAEHPVAATHHQKVLVVDGAIAFCGGFDFAANRWDTREHLPGDPRRRMPTGAPYQQHHDVMLAVDGAAARALGDLARNRWEIATGERLDVPPGGHEAWPQELAPDFADVPVGIVRTAPAWKDRPEIREAEALYLEAIAGARETIYAESQYLASHAIGRALAARLDEPDGPEIVIVTPERAPSWTEQVAMDNARTEIVGRLRDADRHGRFRLYAAVNGDEEIVVHSKVMVVDDRLLRIGSSNLNSRSMGMDTECDLAIEAGPAEEEARGRILAIRHDLVAEHLGVEAGRLADAVARHGSLIRGMEALNGLSERRLVPFPAPRTHLLHRVEHNMITDPARPIGAHRGVAPVRSGQGWAVVLGLATAAFAAWCLTRRRRGWGKAASRHIGRIAGRLRRR